MKKKKKDDFALFRDGGRRKPRSSRARVHERRKRADVTADSVCVGLRAR